MPRISRREAIRWVALAASAMGTSGWGQGQTDSPGPTAPQSPPTGYGPDPDLLRNYAPGDLWPLTLTTIERRSTAALADVIIPADEHSPAASAVGIADFVDEWISAPYPQQTRDRDLLRSGLAWLNQEAPDHLSTEFSALTDRQQIKLCESLATPTAANHIPTALHQFFVRFRVLVIGGFYTTPAGHKDLGYVGNIPLPTFDGPPPKVLARLGID